MLDTNLRKSHKLTVFIIALCILLSALAVVSLYPQTGTAMDSLREKSYQEYENYSENLSEWCVERDFVNYAVEASYYMYGMILQTCENRAVDFSVLDEYGWDSDYHYITEQSNYLAVYKDLIGVDEDYPLFQPETEVLPSVSEPYDAQESIVNIEIDASEGSVSYTEGAWMNVEAAGSDTFLYPFLEGTADEALNKELQDSGILAYLILEYDAYGKLIFSDITFLSDKVRYYGESVYKVAKNSLEQYQDNVLGYGYEYQKSGEFYRVMPKNFKVIFTVSQECDFIFQEHYDSYYAFSSERLFWETGVILVILGIAVLVALAALILPFFRVLNTGWERLFCIHIETLFCIGLGGLMFAYFMLKSMAYTNMYEILRVIETNGDLVFLGYALQPSTIYNCLLVFAFLGWAFCFLLEYIAVSSIRQFISRPGYYLSHRFLFINILKWMCRPIKKLYDYVTDIDVTAPLKNSILKIVIANFVLVTILCCMWFAGIPGTILYSVLLYILLKKFGSRIQKQYESVLEVAKQMARGNLKVTLKEDLGMFSPLGDALTKVQQGFSKAVAEEAKSQNMKTELITNVSHDLKTPLTAIITYVNLLKNPDISEEERKCYMDTLDQKAQRLKALIEDLFEVSKANSGNIHMNLMDVDVVSLMKQIRLEMEDQIADSQLYFRWNLPDEKVILLLDSQRTYRVFENLLNNIFKYSLPGSRVFVDVIQGENDVQICFKNISLKELDFDVDRLTDRFVRGDTARNTEGHGLGLTIAKSFVELQNGTFKIDVDGDLFKVMIRFVK